MTIEVHFPGRMKFGDLHKGKLFFHGSGIYVKSSDDTVTVVYKFAGLMNAGSLEAFPEDEVVQTIKDAIFKIGDY